MSVFRVEPGERGILHLVMDDPARKVNVLDEAALDSLELALEEIERACAAPDARAGVIVRSGKSGSFIAGADIGAIGSMTDRAAVHALVTRAHAVFGRLAALPVPTVAAIDGVCLGGGTELALACDTRIAAEEPHTQIGLPEILLGIIPGFGGSTRLPRLIGLRAALDLILTGRALDARRAERNGLIARGVPQAWLLESAERRLQEIAARPARHRRDRYRPRSLADRFLDQSAPGRALVFRTAREQARARTGGHYPAPLAALRVLEFGLGRSVAESLKLEADEVSELVIGPVCKNLVRIFQLSERAKKDSVVSDQSIRPAKIGTLALVGAGVMGGGIAELASRNGIEVRLRDLQPGSITRALATVRTLIDERSRKRGRGRDGVDGAEAQLARVLPTLGATGFGRADAAIEAVVEDLDVKRRVFAELEVRMRPEALLATNTSSLSVTALAEGLAHPDRFCGFHFFNPVHRMPLVEVVRGERTSDVAMVTAVALARRLGKTPVVVSDAPGFVVNRILMPYLREAMHLLEEGYTVADIDRSMRRFGMPMGPFEVVDEVGLDVGHKVAGVLARAFPDRMTEAPALARLIESGRLGRKNGRGFYLHGGKKRRPDPALRSLLKLQRERRAANETVLSERMVLGMINEGARCLEESVVSDAGMLDLAMIFGAGFPPFRGGLLRHADTLRLPHVVSRLAALAAEKGTRYQPAPLLVRLADRGETFTNPPPA